MTGTSEGARKAVETTKQKHGEDFYSEIGSQSWKDPNRSRKTGFALQTEERRREAGRKGGSRKKEDYKTKPAEAEEVSTGVSE